MTRDDKRRGATFADFADHAAREEAGGRFGAVNEFLAQGELPQYPRQPANSPWSSDLPPEPPTGVDINVMPGQEPTQGAEPGPTRDELIREIARLRLMLDEARSGASAPVIPSSAVERTPEGGGYPGPSPFFSNQREK
jgi:hypothetical protein